MLQHKRTFKGQGQPCEDMVYTAHVSKLEGREIEKSFARLFSSEEGKKILAYLQLTTFHKAALPNVTEEQLRYMEGQRGLVAQIQKLIERGRSA